MTQAIQKYEVNALATIPGGDVFKLGTVLFESGYFRDVKSASQAIVKILRGQELGIGPIAAMENVYVIEGKTALSYSLIGGKIKQSGRYDYRVVEETDDACEIAFYEQGKELGKSRFTMADAQAAGLANKPIWKQYRSTMLFARAMSQGARRFTPDVFGGAIYTPEELQGIREPDAPTARVSLEDHPSYKPNPLDKDDPMLPEPSSGEVSETKKSKARLDREKHYEALWGKYSDILDMPPLNPEWTDEDLSGTGNYWLEKIQEYKRQVPADAVPA